jgi:hypothetical protein
MLKHLWNNKKYNAGKLRFSTHNRISPKVICHLHMHLHKCSTACSRPKKVQRILVWRGAKLLAFPEHHINGLPRMPTCLWPALVLTTAESISLMSWWTCFSKSNLYMSLLSLVITSQNRVQHFQWSYVLGWEANDASVKQSKYRQLKSGITI